MAPTKSTNTGVVPISIGSIPPLSQLDSHVSVSDGEKTGATLLFSGIFLDLVGMTFKVMGWLKYNVSRSFEWTQLLDPILMSVGGTFILISVCMFRILSCRVCKPKDRGEEFSESLTIPGSCQSIVFSGINQPIMFHKATVVQYIPSPYGFVTQEIAGKRWTPYSHVGSVNHHHKLTGRIRMDEDGAVGSRCFRSTNALFTAGDHVNGTLGEVSAEWGAVRLL
ncbi:transmembrane protein 174 [Oncorhynchus tshawytscha]|uniref:transmembrane protein 174 n=1 Tax=Oncorhynchus tshawytscha TaxID=74940 RepID=UPI001C3CAD57|nr:transmembrane protein 174 [Oncorhynchus tshawytscha]